MMIITDSHAHGWREQNDYFGQQDYGFHRLMLVQLLTFGVHIPAEIYFLSESTVTFKVQRNTILHWAWLCRRADAVVWILCVNMRVYTLVQVVKDNLLLFYDRHEPDHHNCRYISAKGWDIIWIFLFEPTVNISTNMNCSCIKAWYIFFLCAIELHCCPYTFENTSMSHMFLHYREHTHCSLF